MSERDRPHQHSRATDGNPLTLLNGDTPWYVRVGVIVLFYFGLPTILVIVLFAMGAGWIPSPITSTHEIAKDLKAHIEHVRAGEEYQLQLLGLICRNTSFTSMQITECQRIVDEAVKSGRERGRHN